MSELGKRPLIREGEFSDRKAAQADAKKASKSRVKAAASIVAILAASVFLLAYFNAFGGGGPEPIRPADSIEAIFTPEQLQEMEEEAEIHQQWLEEMGVETGGA